MPINICTTISLALKLSQTTNVRLFQTQNLQTTISEFDESGRMFSKRVENTGKTRNCSLRAISRFPTVFLKDLYYRHVKTRAGLGKV